MVHGGHAVVMCVDMGDTTLVRVGRSSYTSYERIRPYMARFTENRWTSAIIPALLIHIPIGTVYCWSVFKQLIADRLHASPASVEWGFSLAIFFLGMSAAFAGPMVEKNIKKSALVSMVCFVVGFAGTGVSIALNFLPGVFICYGAIMGIGLGVGYLTPVKNLMLWFADNKGLATGIAVAGFGLAKAIASPLMEYLIGTVGLVSMFFILAAVYAVMMFVGFLLCVCTFTNSVTTAAIYLSEPFPTACRIRGAGVANAFGRLGSIFSPMWIAFLITTSAGTMGVFAINACLCIFMAIWLAIFGVETRGRTLEDITKGLLD